jgi:hypothetical protein
MIPYDSIENYLVSNYKEEKYEKIKKDLSLLSENDIIDSDEEDHIEIKPLNTQSQYIYNFFKNKINKSASKNLIKNKILPSSIKNTLKEKKTSCPNLTEQKMNLNKKMNRTDRKSSYFNLEISIEESTLNTIKSKNYSNQKIKTLIDSNYIQKLIGDDNKTIFSDDDIVV